jgi:alpha-D-ribose 1-methylphosphonate 5-triphosphate diphosphatase PhnM
MHSAIHRQLQSPGTSITKFTNCRLLKGKQLVHEDLWISSQTGQILNGEDVFYDHRISPNQIIDLGGRILSPGLIDVQLNGAYGFNFSTDVLNTASYTKELIRLKNSLIKTGVTSFLPTLTSERPEVYHKVSLLCKILNTITTKCGKYRYFHVWVHLGPGELAVMALNHSEPTVKVLSSTHPEMEFTRSRYSKPQKAALQIFLPAMGPKI